jgi:hypothetical protein
MREFVGKTVEIAWLKILAKRNGMANEAVSVGESSA